MGDLTGIELLAIGIVIILALIFFVCIGMLLVKGRHE